MIRWKVLETLPRSGVELEGRSRQVTGISKHCMEKTLIELFGQPNRIEGLPRWLRGKESTC